VNFEHTTFFEKKTHPTPNKNRKKIPVYGQFFHPDTARHSCPSPGLVQFQLDPKGGSGSRDELQEIT
jgi:hypothetical protein